ncbi:molecular chaperone DnaJ [Mycobacterium yunnanensis]|uniref:Molecular chaperone DnaJ n=1 Tax=Mycobacterium yunnanensis TaxID=368477 RepID=A0A9X2Z9C1_9MYCO|nr:molecular chaperone DnaJ [Mycobacterium yunnanensis]MCV7424374.1 molecular chaperone DnaJ [Mycobacterium yunnanensis]
MTDYPPGMTLRPIAAWPTASTTDRRPAPFESSLTSTLEVLDRELRALGPHGLRGAHGSNWYPTSILQLALREQDFRNDGMPRANAVPSHPGVILNIQPKGKPELSFPCDTFTRWQDNLRGIALGLEALRKLDRYGITQTGQQYTGWRAIEATPSMNARAAACAVLARIAWPNENDAAQAEWAHKIATDPEIGRTTYRKAKANAHPDRNGGSQTLWDHVEGAAKVIGGLT